MATIRSGTRLPGRRAGLTWTDWRLLLTVALAQAITAVALRVMPVAALRTRASRVRRIVRSVMNDSEERVVWALEASGRRLDVFSTCLVRALVAELLLASTEEPTRLTIGVRRGVDGTTIESHAWLARDGRLVIGAPSEGYVPLVEWSSL